MRTSHRWFLALLLAGCSDSSDPGDPPEFVLSPMAQWSGGELTVRSRFFIGRTSLPGVTAAGVPMVVTRVDDSTVSATLPILSTQTVPVEVVEGSNHYDLGSVEVAGYQSHQLASAALYGEPSILTSPSGPVVVAGLPTGLGIGILDAPTGAVRFEIGVHPPAPFYGVGISFDPTIAILRDSNGVAGRWRLWSALQFVDTALQFGGVYSRQLVQLSDSTWLRTSHHETQTIRTGAPTIYVQAESPWGFHLSTAANRALMDLNNAQPGAPVYDMVTGDTVYRLSLNAVEGAVFTQDGSTLFAVGGYAISPNRLVVVNAITGAELLNAVLLPDSVEASSMVLSGDESLLFVMGMADSIPQILVYDVQDLELIGRLMAPASVACSTCGPNLLTVAALLVNQQAGSLYIVNNSSITEIWSFDLLPGLPAPPVRRR